MAEKKKKDVYARVTSVRESKRGGSERGSEVLEERSEKADLS